MRSTMPRAALAAVIAATFAPTAAVATSAVEMAGYCKPIAEARRLGDRRIVYDHTHDAGRCLGFFEGLQQAAGLQFTDGRHPALNLCLTPETTLTQLVLIFRKYVQDHPEQAQEHAFYVTWTALREAFPCKG